MKTGRQVEKCVYFHANIDDSLQFDLLINTMRLPHRMVHIIEDTHCLADHGPIESNPLTPALRFPAGERRTKKSPV